MKTLECCHGVRGERSESDQVPDCNSLLALANMVPGSNFNQPDSHTADTMRDMPGSQASASGGSISESGAMQCFSVPYLR